MRIGDNATSWSLELATKQYKNDEFDASATKEGSRTNQIEIVNDNPWFNDGIGRMKVLRTV